MKRGTLFFPERDRRLRKRKEITAEELREMVMRLDETPEETEKRLHGEAESIIPDEEEFSEETGVHTAAIVIIVATLGIVLLMDFLFGAL